MNFTRSSGVLMPVPSLPGPYGIGGLGAEAYQFIDFLANAKQKLWQILPIGPTGYGDSPYQTFSAFAGNPLWIDPAQLARKGLLTMQELQPLTELNSTSIDYGAVVSIKGQLLELAYTRFDSASADYAEFCASNSWWLDDYALFMAIKQAHNGQGWSTWEHDIKTRQATAVKEWQQKVGTRVGYHRFVQYTFFTQWKKLRQYAHLNQVQIIGDIPIFVAYDSADAWANPQMFLFDDNGNPTQVAGVPPDGFTADGQLWGNPLYNWDYLAKTNFDWWVKRVSWAQSTCDIVRIDHFRGFEAAWQVPANEHTARNGQWVKAPGQQLFATLNKRLGHINIIAEDLGYITPEVEALRDDNNLPGMKILQFGFYDDDTNPYLPQNIGRNAVVYLGTHDNETTLGWWGNLDDKTRQRVEQKLGFYPADICDALLTTAFNTQAVFVIVTMADLLKLDNQARINTPGSSSGNWTWRLGGIPGDDVISYLVGLTVNSKR